MLVFLPGKVGAGSSFGGAQPSAIQVLSQRWVETLVQTTQMDASKGVSRRLYAAGRWLSSGERPAFLTIVSRQPMDAPLALQLVEMSLYRVGGDWMQVGTDIGI